MDIIYIAAFVVLSYTAVNQKTINKAQDKKIDLTEAQINKAVEEAAARTDSIFAGKIKELTH